MKQKEILAAVLIGIFVAVAGWVITTSFIAKPEERFEEVPLVRPFEPDFNSSAIEYLNDGDTKVYNVQIDVEESVGPGNQTPFSER